MISSRGLHQQLPRTDHENRLMTEPTETQSSDDLAGEFNRMRRRLREAHATGRGVNLSAREVQLLGIGVLAEWWGVADGDLDKPIRRD